MTPNQLADELDLDPKVLRRWLRQTFPKHVPHQAWDITAPMADAARRHFHGTQRARRGSVALTEDRLDVIPGETQPVNHAAPVALTANGEAMAELRQHQEDPGNAARRPLADEHPFNPDALDWTPWLPLAEARRVAPRAPGVYMVRLGHDGPIVYVGMAGERRGNGIRGRLSIYTSGKGMVSGLGEHVMDRALADLDFLAERIAEVSSGRPRRATEWAKVALEWADLHVRCTIVVDRAAAMNLERQVLNAVGRDGLWNRR